MKMLGERFSGGPYGALQGGDVPLGQTGIHLGSDNPELGVVREQFAGSHRRRNVPGVGNSPRRMGRFDRGGGYDPRGGRCRPVGEDTDGEPWQRQPESELPRSELRPRSSRIRVRPMRSRRQRKRSHAPYYELAELELTYLQDTGGKVDHPSTGPVRTKDVFDAMASVADALIGDQMASYTGQAFSDVPLTGALPRRPASREPDTWLCGQQVAACVA